MQLGFILCLWYSSTKWAHARCLAFIPAVLLATTAHYCRTATALISLQLGFILGLWYPSTNWAHVGCLLHHLPSVLLLLSHHSGPQPTHAFHHTVPAALPVHVTQLGFILCL
jgi:hypothetical protein